MHWSDKGSRTRGRFTTTAVPPSLGLSAGLRVLGTSPHPPAGATTLIISLGILMKPWQLVLLLVAVVLLTLQAFAMN